MARLSPACRARARHTVPLRAVSDPPWALIDDLGSMVRRSRDATGPPVRDRDADRGGGFRIGRDPRRPRRAPVTVVGMARADRRSGPVRGRPVAFRGSEAVAAGLVGWSTLRGPRFRRIFPDVHALVCDEPDPLVLERAASVLVGDGECSAGSRRRTSSVRTALRGVRRGRSRRAVPGSGPGRGWRSGARSSSRARSPSCAGCGSPRRCVPATTWLEIDRTAAVPRRSAVARAG